MLLYIELLSNPNIHSLIWLYVGWEISFPSTYMYLEQEKSFFDVEELQASLHTWTSQSNKTPRCELHIVRWEPEGHYPHVNVYELTPFWLWADNVFRRRVQPCFPPLREAVEKHVFVCLCSRLSTWFHFVNFAWTVLTWFLGGYEIQFHFTLWIECRGFKLVS